MSKITSEQQIVHALLRQHFPSFIERVFLELNPGDPYLHNWHIQAMAYYLECCREGYLKRLIINVPPRYLKSICTSVALVAFALGRDPTQRFICVSYSQLLASDLHRLCVQVMESPWYRQVFPATRLKRGTQDEIITTKGGRRLATSIGGSLTGQGADVIILDDPHKTNEAESEVTRKKTIDFYRQTLVTRLDNKKDGVLILVQQRIHEYDLSGYLLEAGGWEHLNLPAVAEEPQEIWIGDGDDDYVVRKPGDVLHPERESLEMLEQLKSEQGSAVFAAQYQQRPVPVGGGIVKWEWFPTYKFPIKVWEPGDRIVLSVDVAVTTKDTSDYSVVTVWLCSGKNFTLIDVFRERVEFPDLRYAVKRLYKEYRANAVLIECVGAGTTLAQMLSWGDYMDVIKRTPKGDKEARMKGAVLLIEAGRVYLPEDAPWLAEVRDELVRFPQAKHDDIADSVSQFLLWAHERDYQPPQNNCRIYWLG